MRNKPFVIKHIGCQDSKCFAVVEHQRDGLKVWGWYSKEDDARALAHTMEYPDD